MPFAPTNYLLLIMNTTLKPINLFEDLSLSSTTGQLEIRKNAVSWQLSLLDGKLEFATHSLQSGNTLKYYLRSIGYENAVKIDFLTESKSNIKQLIYFLEKDNFINTQQKTIIQKKLQKML